MQINTDLHLHSKYSMATSKNMDIETLASQSKKKGLNLIATGDAFHTKWLNELEENLSEIKNNGIYQTNDSSIDTKFIITNEVEDNQRIHHLILIPSIDTAWDMRDEFIVKNMDADGRPKIRMNAEEIFEIAHKYKCLIGPAHIFTPWTGLYKEYSSIYDCYKQRPDFVELGLSADTNLADRIGELKDYTFLTNSDSHSPWPHRIGREFNTLEIDEYSFKAIADSIKKNKVVKNYGLNPYMGKYHETGCSSCYKLYDIGEATRLKMKCSCGGRIKKGVKSRIDELSDYDEPKHPKDRPKYQYILPLAELISTAHSKTIMTKYVQSRYDNLIDIFGNEIDVLTSIPLEKIEDVDKLIVPIIKSYRENNLSVIPGRGGQYGRIDYAT